MKQEEVTPLVPLADGASRLDEQMHAAWAKAWARRHNPYLENASKRLRIL